MPTPTNARTAQRPSPLGLAAAAWGLAGVGALLTQAIWRLTPHAVDAFARHRLTPLQWLAAAAGVAFMGFFEGYKGFQRGFSPRVVVRAIHLSKNPRPLHVALAPLFSMGLLHASRRRLVASWSIVVAVFLAVVLVHRVAQPWRGIIDAGVVVGLAWGLAAVVAFTVRAVAGRPPAVAADLPPGREPADALPLAASGER
jgi:hypothetical protein